MIIILDGTMAAQGSCYTPPQPCWCCDLRPMSAIVRHACRLLGPRRHNVGIGVLYPQPSSSILFLILPLIMARARALYVLLSLLGLFLIGTVIVLSSVSYYLAIDQAAYLTDSEVPTLDNVTRWNATEYGKIQRIPRILHQTWKSETLPTRWKGISQACRNMMPD